MVITRDFESRNFGSNPDRRILWGESYIKFKKGFSALHVCGGMCNIEEENRPHLSLSYFSWIWGFSCYIKGGGVI